MKDKQRKTKQSSAKSQVNPLRINPPDSYHIIHTLQNIFVKLSLAKLNAKNYNSIS